MDIEKASWARSSRKGDSAERVEDSKHLVGGAQGVQIVVSGWLAAGRDGGAHSDGAVRQRHDSCQEGHHPQAVEVGALQEQRASEITHHNPLMSHMHRFSDLAIFALVGNNLKVLLLILNVPIEHSLCQKPGLSRDSPSEAKIGGSKRAHLGQKELDASEDNNPCG